jgi:hypothetical protein
MTTYEETIAALQSMRSIAAHLTALQKIRVKTEDTQLEKLLGNALTSLQNGYALAAAKKSPGLTTPTALADGNDADVKAVIAYCQTHIGTSKPEWQVLAERHGWTPPQP